MKGGAFAGRALDSDRAAQELAQALADREAEPRAAVPARRRRVSLRERREQLGEALGVDPDAGVVDGEGHLHPLLVERRRHDVHGHAPLRRELDRVAEQVPQDLSHPAGVGDDRRRAPVRDLVAGLEPLLDRRGGHLGQGVLDDAGDVDRLGLDLELARLDLREIEDVADEHEQGIAAGADDVEAFALVGAHVGVGEERRHPDHGVERSAQLVAHRGEKLALRPRRRERRVTRLGDVEAEPQELGCRLRDAGAVLEDEAEEEEHRDATEQAEARAVDEEPPRTGDEESDGEHRVRAGIGGERDEAGGTDADDRRDHHRRQDAASRRREQEDEERPGEAVEPERDHVARAPRRGRRARGLAEVERVERDAGARAGELQGEPGEEQGVPPVRPGEAAHEQAERNTD